MGPAPSITTYCIQLVGHCTHCMTTASKFPDNVGGNASTAGTLHTAEVALQAQCINDKLTESISVGTAAPITTYDFHLVGHCNYCIGTASKFREL